MRVCFDTNVFLSLFSKFEPFPTIRTALLKGRVTILISNEILFEYQEIVQRKSRNARWVMMQAFLDTLRTLHGNVIEVSPHFRFLIISADADDNKFSDCAVAGNGQFVVTNDKHFVALVDSGYRPQPITAKELARHLGWSGN